LIKDKERKIALDDWLRNKRAEEKKKNSMTKFVTKKNHHHLNYQSNLERHPDKNITHTLLPHKIKPVLYETQNNQPSPQVQTANNNHNNKQMFTNMQNALNSQNMPKQMNLSKTLNLNELKEYQHMNQADFLQSDGDMAQHQANTLNQ